jgi:hypothetical protein
MQVDFEQAQTETQSRKFIKEYVSLIWLLLTIIAAVVGRILKKQPAVHPIM